jgi:hypothetical protein
MLIFSAKVFFFLLIRQKRDFFTTFFSKIICTYYKKLFFCKNLILGVKHSQKIIYHEKNNLYLICNAAVF